MSTIPPYTHECIIKSGSLQGNTRSQDVSHYDVEYGMTCDNCDEVLATPSQIAVYLYKQLIGE